MLKGTHFQDNSSYYLENMNAQFNVIDNTSTAIKDKTDLLSTPTLLRDSSKSNQLKILSKDVSLIDDLSFVNIMYANIFKLSTNNIVSGFS
jgi:hypothetical protein